MKPSQDLKSTADLRKLDIAKLNQELKVVEHGYFKIKLETTSSSSGRVDLPSKYRQQIARIKTIRKEKEQESAVSEQAKTEEKAEKAKK